MSLFSDLAETLKVECTKANKNKVSFVVSNLKAEAKNLDLTIPYFTLMQAFQNSQYKAS